MLYCDGIDVSAWIDQKLYQKSVIIATNGI